MSKGNCVEKFPLILRGTYFEVVSRNGEVFKAKCLGCVADNKKTFISGSRTSNYLTHLKRRHPDLFKEYEKQMKPRNKIKRQVKGTLQGLEKNVGNDEPSSSAAVKTLPKFVTHSTGNLITKALDEVNNFDGDDADFEGETSHHSHEVHHFRWNQNQKCDRLLEKLKDLYQGTGGNLPLADVILFSSDGKCVEAHKLILSLGSTYFQQLFATIGQAAEVPRNNPSPTVVVLGNVKGSMLQHLVQFIYTGEAAVKLENMDEFLNFGGQFQIDGISSSRGQQPQSSTNNLTNPAFPNFREKRPREPSSSPRIVNVTVVRNRNRGRKRGNCEGTLLDLGEMNGENEDEVGDLMLLGEEESYCKTEPAENSSGIQESSEVEDSSDDENNTDDSEATSNSNAELKSKSIGRERKKSLPSSAAGNFQPKIRGRRIKLSEHENNQDTMSRTAYPVQYDISSHVTSHVTVENTTHGADRNFNYF